MAGQIVIKPCLVDDHGTWTVRARFPDTPFGKPKLHSMSTGLKVCGNNKRKAEAAMREISSQWERMVKEKTSVDPNATFGECVDSWLRTKEQILRHGTMDCYYSINRCHISPTIGRIKLRDLTRQDIQEYFNKIAKDLSPTSLRKHNVVIRGALRQAVIDGLLPPDHGNVLTMVELPKKRKYEGKALSDEQIKAVFANLADEPEPIPSIMILGICYGLRRSEMCGLRWGDVDFENNVVHIRNTVVNHVGGRDEGEHTKTMASRRDITMIAATKDYLLGLYERRQKQGMVSDKVCAYENGEQAKPDYLSRYAKVYMEKCGIPNMRLHDLRHTAATVLVKRMPVIYVSKFLGHNQVSTTMDIYSHVLDGERDRASTTMDKYLESAVFCSEKCSENHKNY